MLQEIYNAFLSSTGVCTDTRAIVPGSLFFCLKGGNFDGNQFAEDALKMGANYAIIDDVSYEIPGKTFLVDDVLDTLQKLANLHRKQFSIPIIGITGSNGKTTSKELIATVLETTLNVLYTKGNLNNHIGVPLTLLRLTRQHEIAVIEMGANKPGDIQELCHIAEPTHGIITNIGRAHLEGFGNLGGVVTTKTALYRSVAAAGGDLFVNSDDPVLMEHLPKHVKIHTYGESGEVKGKLIKLDPFVNMQWSTGDYTSPELRMKLVGHYNFLNYLAAIRIGLFFQVSPDKINGSLESYTPSNNRSQITETVNNTLIVDCYNANPTSMTSAIESFAAINHPNKIFILGDMREMGEESRTVHEEILQLTKEKLLNGFFVGEEFLQLNTGGERNFFSSVEELAGYLTNEPIKNAMVLLKGSRGIRLETLLSLL